MIHKKGAIDGPMLPFPRPTFDRQPACEPQSLRGFRTLASVCLAGRSSGNSSWNGFSGSRFATSCLIGKPLALCAFDRGFGAVHVVNTERDPIVVTEIKFREITVQVVLATMLIDALHTALEHAVEAFNSVRMDVAVAHILASAVRSEVVGREVLVKMGVLASFVRHHVRSAGHVRLDNG